MCYFYNRVVGITGRSGSGKSTFLKLLMRFWQIDSGSLTISGREVDEINTANLRDMESFVTQETHLFSGSIFDNLRAAKEDATMDEMIEACQKASIVTLTMAFGFIMMSKVPVGRIILACVWVFHILYFCLGVKTIHKNT